MLEPSDLLTIALDAEPPLDHAQYPPLIVTVAAHDLLDRLT